MDLQDNSGFILPINVGHECQILMHNNDELRQCQHDAFITWIRPWQLEQQQQQSQLSVIHQLDFEGPEQLNGKNPCCYRWALLDCLSDSVQKYCPLANTFDLRTFLIKREEVIFYYESFQCKDHPFDGLHCHISTWAIVVSILLIIFLFALIFVLSFYTYRHMVIHNTKNHRPDCQKNKKKIDPVTDL